MATVIELSESQIEAAAREACRIEGWNPDKMTGKDRPLWQVYAELLRAQFLPAINRALAGVEGKPPCPAEASESPPSSS